MLVKGVVNICGYRLQFFFFNADNVSNPVYMNTYVIRRRLNVEIGICHLPQLCIVLEDVNSGLI